MAMFLMIWGLVIVAGGIALAGYAISINSLGYMVVAVVVGGTGALLMRLGWDL